MNITPSDICMNASSKLKVSNNLNFVTLCGICFLRVLATNLGDRYVCTCFDIYILGLSARFAGAVSQHYVAESYYRMILRNYITS